MSYETRSWCQISKDRLSASHALTYVVDVIDGKVDEPDRVRLDSCWKALDKLIPTIKATEFSGEVHLTEPIHWVGDEPGPDKV